MTVGWTELNVMPKKSTEKYAAPDHQLQTAQLGNEAEHII